MALLDGVEPDREREDQDDDEPADVVAGQHRDDAGHQQDQRQRLEQPAEDRARRALEAWRCVAVRPEAVEAFGGLGGGQPLQRTAELRAESFARQAPEMAGLAVWWLGQGMSVMR